MIPGVSLFILTIIHIIRVFLIPLFLRKAVIAPFDGLCSADMYPLNTAINRKYLLRYMLSDAFNLRVATAMLSRVKMAKINQDELSKILIPIPPMQEQERIVSKIEELFDKITLI